MPDRPVHDASTTPPRAGGRVRVLLGIGATLPALLFFALAAYSLSASRAQYERRAELLTQNLAEALEQGLTEHVGRVDMALSAISQLVEIRLRSGALDKQEVADLIQAQKGVRVDLQGLRVMDAQGTDILADPPRDGSAPLNYADREWFIAHRDAPNLGLTMSRPLISKISGQLIVAFTRRYNGPDGRFAGCVSTSVPLSYFQTRLEGVDVGSDGFVTVRNTSFELIARKNRVMSMVDAPGSTKVSNTFRQMVESGQTRATYRSRNPIDDLERTNTMRRLSVVPLIVVVGLSSKDYLIDWYREVRAVTGLSAALLLLYLGGGCVVWRLRTLALQGRARIELLAKVFEHSAEAIVVADGSKRIIEVNPAFVRQSGYRPEEVIGIDPLLLHSPRTAAEKHDDIRTTMAQRGTWRGEVWCRTKDNRDYPAWLSISVLTDSQGRVTHHIGSSTDMTEQKMVEDRVRHIAHHDALTQLPNRTLLHDRLEHAMLQANRDGAALAMLFIDMDRFKNINDTLGHPVGDSLLIEVGKRLTSLVSDTDIVARLGGDEFVVVLTGLDQEAASIAAGMARKLMVELGRPYTARGHVLHSTPSIGIGVYPGDGDDADTLLQHADAAMYQAKAAGRNNYQFFTRALNEATVERLGLEAGLRGAVERGEMFLHYQPQLDLHSGRVVALEALLRWQHPEMGLVAPMKFIPVAEDTGQIEAIGAWVLDQALQQLARWRAAGHAQLRVAVNLSAHQLRGEAIVGNVAQALLRHRLPGQALELEITESVAMQDPVRTAQLLRELRGQGVALAIDDFGTGYSSLAYLKQLPLSCLKLDRSFVTEIESDPNDAAICTATIQLAHSLGLGVVAEGVETQAQFEFLRRLGCDTVQGYLISRPLSVDDCTRFVAAAIAPEMASEMAA